MFSNDVEDMPQLSIMANGDSSGLISQNIEFRIIMWFNGGNKYE